MDQGPDVRMFEGRAYDGPLEGRTFRWTEDNFACRLFPGTEEAPGEPILHEGIYRWSEPLRAWVFDWEKSLGRRD